MTDRTANPGPGSRVERKKESTRLRIIETAMQLYRTEGVNAVTMEQVADAADVAKSTLYNYFPVKEAIISEYIERNFRGANAERIAGIRELPDTAARMKMILNTLIEGIVKSPDIFEKYFTYNIKRMLSLQRIPGMASGMRSLAREIVVLGQAGGELRQDIPVDILVGFFEFVFVEVAQEYYMNPGGFNAATTIASCTDLFMNGAGRDRTGR